MTKKIYSRILQRELVPALGCTEPIAIAFAAATASKALACEPERMSVACSGNVIKNVKGVLVPNSGGMKGIEAAAALGALGGDCDKHLEVLSALTPETIEKAKAFIAGKRCAVEVIPDSPSLYILVNAYCGSDVVVVEMRDSHRYIARIEKNGELLYCGQKKSAEQVPDYSQLTVRGILSFAQTVSIAEVAPLLDYQIRYNADISTEGLSGDYGASVGKTLLKVYGDDVRTRAKAKAAAASDARMGGCKLPVVINSGSGNQGLTVSLPVIEYAKELRVSDEMLYRALVVSNLVSIHIKHGIGVLSAFCGAVSAACGSGAGIAFLHGGDYQLICNTIINTLANVSGIICDGAKPSCAVKIASSVDAAILAYHMAAEGKVFAPGDGIVQDNVEKMIAAVAEIGRQGMRETDANILDIMTRDSRPRK